MKEENKLQKLMDDISSWSDSVFGVDQRNPGIVYHLKEEVDELIEAQVECLRKLSDPRTTSEDLDISVEKVTNEFADCFMLLLDSAVHFHYTADELIYATRRKLEINKKRKWGNPDKNGVINHIS
ncbi:MAG: DUF550 domain-containing protein [Candidatus Kapabacteria bacterium]|jgi:hypothetical protein|nr:DUF550 domain-containing protein [Candidatus Kapabacteria bacterium]